MKNIISFSLFLLLFSINSFILNAQSFSIEKNITYLGYDETVKHLPVFTYEIKNTSKDTLYISEDEINIIVSKNNQILTDEEYDNFIPPHKSKKDDELSDQWFDQEERLLPLKQAYANKLYVENFGFMGKYQKIRNNVIHDIVSKCIVILPNEKVVLGRGFCNKVFDEKCKVEIQYNYNKIFTYFIDDNSEKINIYH